MTIHQMNENGTVTLQPEGWLDTITSPEPGSVIDAIDAAEILVLDFEKVEYMSSAGLRQVVTANNKAKSLNADFRVINVVPSVMNIFKMTGIDKKLDIRAI